MKGFSVCQRLENTEVKGDSPVMTCKIIDCGQLKPGEDDGTAIKDDGTGDKFPIFPDDIEDLTTAKRIEIAAELKQIANSQYKGLTKSSARYFSLPIFLNENKSLNLPPPKIHRNKIKLIRFLGIKLKDTTIVIHWCHI